MVFKELVAIQHQRLDIDICQRSLPCLRSSEATLMMIIRVKHKRIKIQRF